LQHPAAAFKAILTKIVASGVGSARCVDRVGVREEHAGHARTRTRVRSGSEVVGRGRTAGRQAAADFTDAAEAGRTRHSVELIVRELRGWRGVLEDAGGRPPAEGNIIHGGAARTIGRDPEARAVLAADRADRVAVAGILRGAIDRAGGHVYLGDRAAGARDR